MALKIKLSRFGTRHTPVYRVVIKEERSRRDGASVEQIGTYQPRISDTPLKLDLERVDYWISKGAVPTDTVRALIKRARRKAASAPAAEPATDLERMPIVGAASSGDQVSLQLEHVLARNHRHAADLREVGGQRFGDALPDPLVGGIAGDVRER